MHPLLTRSEMIDGVMTVRHLGFWTGLLVASSASLAKSGVVDSGGVDNVLPYVARLALRRAFTFEGRVLK
jgi:hypothetical protein